MSDVIDYRYYFIFSLLVPIISGCSDSGPTLSPVSGTVLIDGKPVTHGFVRVMPEGYRPAHGKLDENGTFELTTETEGDGCVHGTHRVTVTALEMLPGSSQKWHAPKAYSDTSTSDLTVDISGPTSELEIDLTWRGGKPFVESFSGEE